ASPAVLSLTDRTAGDASELAVRLNALGFRASVDLRGEKIGYKIREAQLEKIPYMVILGDKEKENGLVAIRSRGAGDLGVMTEAEFTERLRFERDNRIIN
ncbi:MAG: His/Gly/Thr/Pro-type tRNA ligase C-terminal domain-containing protein, partial [Clostridia bacterium]